MAYVSERRKRILEASQGTQRESSKESNNKSSGYVSERRKRILEGGLNKPAIEPAPVKDTPEIKSMPERMVTPSVTKQRSFTPEEQPATPLDQSRYNVFGQGLLPRYEEDKPLEAIGKDIVNYGLGTLSRIVSAPQQAIMQTVTNTANVIEGKPLDFSQKTLREDILPTEYDKALRELAEKGTAGKLASDAIDMLINAGLDPATYVGGGIVDDLARAGMMGKASRPSTEFVKVVGDRQKAMLAKQTAKETAQAAATEALEPQPLPETMAGEIGRQKPVKSIDDYIQEQKQKVEDLRYQRTEYGTDTTNDIQAAEDELLRLQRKKYLPYYKEQMANLEKTQKEIFDANNDITPEFADISDRITKLKQRIADIEGEKLPEIPAAKNAVETVPPSSETPPVSAQPTAERVNTPTDVETPPVTSQEVKPIEVEPVKPSGTPMLERTPVNVGSTKVKSYQFENPEVKPYYQDYAQYILDNEFVPNEQLYRTTDIMQKLKADTGLQPAQVKDALERLVKNKGQENVAAAKRAEMVIDDMLTNGFTTAKGDKVPPIENYISLKSKIEGKEITPRPEQTLDDMPVPESSYAVAHGAPTTEAKNIAESAKPDAELTIGKAPATAEERKFVDDISKTMPDDEEGLAQTIADLEQQAKVEKDEGKLLKINLQLFAANEKLKAISQLKTNTLKKAPAFQDDEIQKAIEEIDMEYGVKTHKQTIERAKAAADTATDATIEDLRKNGLKSAEDTATAYFLTKKLAEEGKATGDFTKLKSFLKGVQRSGTSHGQTIEAFKIWQQEPDGMLKNATKVVEDAEDVIKKSDPEKIKKIDNETKRVIDEIDKADTDAADQIQDEVNKKTGEILGKKQSGTPNDGGIAKKPPKDENPPEEMLAKKIENYTKDPKLQENDPVKDMVNELFKVAKESPVTREKVQSKSAIEFVAEALKNRQQFVEVWTKAKEIVREKVKDNPDALAKLEAYFDKGIKPPFSSESFNKSIKEGMKALDQNLGKIVKDYYAQGSRSRQNLVKYLVEKSGLDGQDAEILAKYVQNRMKELTKAKKEEILKGIFKDQTASTAKPGALKSIEELSNVGAFVNDNYKAKVMEKLSSRLQRLINEKFKGTPTKASGATGISDRIDFGELVRKSVSEIDFTRTKLLKEISEAIQVNDADARTILKAVEDRFNEIVDEKRASILGNMFKKREATVKKTGIQRVQEYINKQVELENLGAQEDAIRDFIKEKYGLPTLTNDDMAFITSHIDKLKGLEQGTRPYNETLWRIYNRIESKVPSNFIEKFRAWQRISMLPNVKTFLRNILGNVFMEKAENFNELTTEALVDMIASAFTGKRTILGPTAAIQKSIAQAKGKLKGLNDVVIDIGHKVNTYDVQGQYEINVSRNAFKNPVLNALEQFTNKTLQFGDRPFYEAAKARRIAELKQIKKVTEVTDDMEADAILYALDRTFQNDSKLAMGVQKMKNAIDDPVYKTIANIVVPFARTPANILDKVSDYTPIGLIKTVGHLGKTAGKGTFNQQYFSQRLGRMLTGSGIITLGYILAQKGIITGKPVSTTNGNKKGNFDKETGKLGYALKLGDQYVAYDWAQPIGSLLALGADAFGQGMNKGDVLKGLEGAGNTFFNMSMLQSLNSLMSYGNPMGGFISTMLGANQQFTPTIFKQAARIADKFERDTSGEGYWEETAKRFMSGVPGLRNTLPVKTDTFGKPVETQEGYGPLQKALNIAVNPAIVSKNTMKDYEKEMERLYNLDLGDMRKTDVLPSVLERTISDGKGTEYTLTPEQYNRYKKLYGDIAVDGLRDEKGRLLRLGLEVVIRSADYKKLSDKDKAKRISGILSKAQDKAKDKMLDELKK